MNKERIMIIMAQNKLVKSIYEPKLKGNIIEHMLEKQDMSDQTRRYFEHKSKFFRALEKFVVNYAPKEESIFCYSQNFLDEGMRVLRSNCHLSIDFRRAVIYGISAGNTERNFDLTFSVTYEYEHNECNRLDKEYTICVPSDLELNFTQKKFDAWINEQREENVQSKVKRILETINRSPNKKKLISMLKEKLA